MRSRKIQRLTFTALMTAAAVVLTVVEGLLPVAPFMPPASKLGLSNIVIMYSAFAMTIPETLFIVIAKACFVFITRGVTAFLMSLAGGFLSALCLIFIFRKAKGFGFIGTGVASALCHNAGQILVSFIIMQTKAVIGYAPVLVIMSVVTGIITGLLLKVSIPYLKDINKYIAKEREE